MTEKRTDVHRPSAIDPADYELAAPMPGVKAPHCGPFMDYGSVSKNCDHCGHALRYAVRFLHKPTGGIVIFGEDCTNLIDLPQSMKDRVGYELNRLRIAAANERKKLKKEQEWVDRRARMMQEEPEIVEFLEELPESESFPFLKDMVWAYEKWGSLTVGQINAVKKIQEKRKAKAAQQLADAIQLQDAPEAPEGKASVTGTILSTKWQSSRDFGDTLKMRVKLDDGNIVYGSVPNSIQQAVHEQGSDYRNVRVSFSANFTRKEDHFSYFKRPTQGKVVA
jgi:hypothetical protein